MWRRYSRRADVEDAIVLLHERRSWNTGAAGWLAESGRLAYNYPADDALTALV